MTKSKQSKTKRAHEALNYHEFPKPGKLEIRATKPMANARDLSNAYSPGVAEACLKIKERDEDAVRYTAKGNLVAVISNGTAVLGLGDIGAQASKPVMEGKAVLFKKFAGIDCFDLEVNETDPEKLADIVAKLAPTFGAVNLEDIKAPDCFIVEELCHQKMNIPVFHDDQHGTAIVVAAAAYNAMHLAGKEFEDIKVVSTGGGAAGIACLNTLMGLGVKQENIWLIDEGGLITPERAKDLDKHRGAFAQASDKTELKDVIEGADMFLGLSAPNILTEADVKKMAGPPIIFALANPVPEIDPALARKAAPDALIATGRSDTPNQVNNVLCFPFIFRGALDVAATRINNRMKLACVKAIAGLARETTTAEVGEAYNGERLAFGPDYLIPKPFDPRLLPRVATAVAKAAMESGAASREIDLEAYEARLEAQIYKSSMVMRPIFAAANTSNRRIIFAEGEDERVLRTAQAMIEDGVDTPILIGRPEVVNYRLEQTGLKIRPSEDFELINPQQDDRYRDYWTHYLEKMKRQGVSLDMAKTILRTNTTAIGAVAVDRGDADSLICGTMGEYRWHLKYVRQILANGELHPIGTTSMILLDRGALFLADTHIHIEPTPEEIANVVVATARHVRRFGLEPKIALCSGSQFGNLDSRSGRAMRAALAILDKMDLDFEYEGEMQTDAALDPELRERLFPGGRLTGKANALIYSNTDAAGATRNILKSEADGLEVGPILMGMGNRAHIVTPSVTARALLNMSALAGMPVASYG